MDFIAKLPRIKRLGATYDSILVVVDRFTKMACYIPCSERIKATKLLDRLEKHIFLKWGYPDEIVSDRGSRLHRRFLV